MGLERGIYSMSEAALTLEGWYSLHDFRTIDWAAWRLADEANEAQWMSCNPF